MIDRLLATPPRLGAVRLVAIDGPSGSGKSVLAAALTRDLRARGVRTALVPTDDFATWEDPVSWWPRLVDGVLTPLRAGRAGHYRRNDWTGGTARPGEWITVEVPELLVVEGVSAGRRSVRADLSALIWCEVPDPATRLARAVARDGAVNRDFLRSWQEFEKGWFAVDGTREAATRIHRP